MERPLMINQLYLWNWTLGKLLHKCFTCLIVVFDFPSNILMKSHGDVTLAVHKV